MAYSTSDLLGNFDALATTIARLIPHDRLAVATREEPTGVFRWRAVAGLPGNSDALSRPINGVAVSALFADVDSLLITAGTKGRRDAHSATFAPLLSDGIASAIVVPMRWSGQIAGLMLVASTRRDAYSERELVRARELGSLLSGVVIADSLRFELDREIVELNTLAELGRLLISGDEWTEHIDRCAALVRRLIDYDRFSISLFEPSTGTIDTAYFAGDDLQMGNSRIQIPIAELESYFAPGEAYLPTPAQMKELARRVPEVGRILNAGGFRSLISAPLRWRGTFVGAMQVFSRTESRYAERDRVTFDRIASHISGALAIARLTESLREDVHERMALADLSRILASAQDPREVVEPFAEKLHELLKFDALFVNIVEYSEGTVLDWFSWGVGLPGTYPGHRRALAGTLTERVASSREVFRYCARDEEDALENIPNSIVPVRAGLLSWLSAPMISNGRVVGTIHLRSKLPNAYTPRSEALLERVASQVAGAFANAIAHEREIALAAEREKSLRLAVEKQELQRLNEMRDRFLGMVSHELKTPLTSVYAFANILARNNSHNLTPRQLNHIRVIQRNSRRLDMMIGDLLDVSRIEQGTFSLMRSPFNPRSMVAEVVESLEPILEEKSQVLEIVSDLGDDMIDADRNRISQVVANLVSNASKYSRERDTITLRTWVSGTVFSVSVEDQGVGIAPDEVGRVFEPFYRIDNDITRRAPGTGIGLFVARTIVEQHGGKIEVQSQPGYGTVVRFWVPKTPPSDDTPASRVE